MALPTQHSFMSETSSVLQQSEAQLNRSSSTVASQNVERNSFFQPIQSRRTKPMLNSMSMPTLRPSASLSELRMPVVSELKILEKRESELVKAELQRFNRRLNDIASSKKQQQASKVRSRALYGPSAVMEALEAVGQPCPPMRASHLVSVNDGDRDGFLTRSEMHRMLEDAQGTSSLHKELQMAWGYIAQHGTPTNPAAIPRPSPLTDMTPLALPSIARASNPLTGPQLLDAYHASKPTTVAMARGQQRSRQKSQGSSRPETTMDKQADDARTKRQLIDPLRPLAGQLSDMYREQMKQILEVFIEWDTDGNNSVSFEEFTRAMTSLGLKPSKKLRNLWKDFDRDGSGGLDYQELLIALAPPKVEMAPKTYQDAASRRAESGRDMKVTVTAEIRTPAKQLNEAFSEIASDRLMDALSEWDEDNDGTISRHEFGKAMAAIGLKATKVELMKYFNLLDLDNSGTISYSEWHEPQHLDMP